MKKKLKNQKLVTDPQYELNTKFFKAFSINIKNKNIRRWKEREKTEQSRTISI